MDELMTMGMNTPIVVEPPARKTTALNVVDPAAIASAENARAMIESAYIMAHNNPRNYDEARYRILKACQRPAFAERVEYAKPIGKNNLLRGPSIRFAELCIREWGNIDCQNCVIYEDDKVRRIRITITDLESNARLSKDIQISKVVERKSSAGREVVGQRTNSYNETVYIVKATDDELQTKTDALVSKAIRNEGLRLIPQDIIDEGILVARQTIANGRGEDPDMTRKKLMVAFQSIGITPDEIARYVGHSTDALLDREIEDLRLIYQSVKNGETRWSEFVGGKTSEEETDSASKAKAKLNELKAKKKKKEEQPVVEATVIQNAEPVKVEVKDEPPLIFEQGDLLGSEPKV